MAQAFAGAYIASMVEAADWARETEARLLDAALPHVRELGWTSRLVRRAAAQTGLTPAEAELLLPQGARDLVALFSYRQDETAMASLAEVDPAGLKIRERIARGVQARVAAAAADETASRRLMGYLALPQNLALGARLSWESADRIWRWAGDTSSDENHVSKRVILAGLLTSTLAVRLADPSAADEHLQRGIGAVMAYERAKARFNGRFGSGDPAAAAARFLGRLRHARPAGPGATRA